MMITQTRSLALNAIKKLIAVAVGLGLGLALPGASPAAEPPADPIVFSFATVGDSRHDPEALDITAADKIWLQNTRVLARLLREIQAQKPQALFFNGDMIMGYTTNAAVLNRQYAYWRGMVAGLQESGTYLVPVPGNHEVQIKTTDVAGKPAKVAMVASEHAWRDNLGDLIFDTTRWKQMRGAAITAWDVQNTPVINGADAVKSDQRQLTYSFDYLNLHFVVINTDAFSQDSHAPVAWLAEDLARAQARGARRQFVFGHKMAYTYFYDASTKPKGFDLFPDNQRAFWDLMEKYQATYFCGHEHIYHSMQPRAEQGGKAWQIIVGSGGSPFEAGPGDSHNPNDRKYAWALVKIHRSGRVRMEAHGFDEHLNPTHLIERLELAQPAGLE